MNPQFEFQAEAAMVPSAPRIGRVPDGAARPRVLSWFMASFLHVAVAMLIGMQM